MESAKLNDRYSRQLRLKEFGEAAQQKLGQANILVIGAGGLGCAALQYLAAAGIGTIGIVDFDTVALSNLQRQVLYDVTDLGQPKAETAARKLNALNPEIKIVTHQVQISNSNALELISKYDLVMDGSDNFATRYLVNDACVLLNKPLVYGAVLRFEGQIGVFNLIDEAGIKTNYRDMFPEPPDPANALSCTEAGVLGVLPGLIGTLQATEAIKIITGIGNPLANEVLTYNALENTFYTITISENPNASEKIPKDALSFLNFNYEWFCNGIKSNYEIATAEFNNLLKEETLTIIDVREPEELPVVYEFPSVKVPLKELEKYLSSFSTSHKIVVFCNSGQRSLQAIKIFKSLKPEAIAFSLQGGIEGWKKENIKIKDSHDGEKKT